MRTSKEAMDRWNKSGIEEIKDTKLARKSTLSRRVNGKGCGGRNS